MTPDQFSQLLTILKQIVARQYTLTGAADWPLLAFLCVIIFALIGLMWRDLRSLIQGNKTESDDKIKTIKEEFRKDIDKLWQAQRDCQNDCCPRKKRDDK